jgi:predicted TIM-barrel fold metal-dependent hydrolase
MGRIRRFLFCALLAFPASANADLIDAHAHIGTFRGFDVSLPTLLSAMAKAHVRLALISNIDGAELPGTTANLDEDRANAATIEAVRAHPTQLRAILWSRPVDGDPAHLENLLRDPKVAALVVGVKLHPEFNHFVADDRRADGYLALCERHHLAAVFHSGGPGSASSAEKIYALARRHPTVPVVLYHMGFNTDHEEAIAAVARSVEKKDARLYLDTAQVEPEKVLEAVKRVGSDRVLFGTDATYFGAEHYREYESLLKVLKRSLSDEDFAKVTARNAEAIFRLK